MPKNASSASSSSSSSFADANVATSNSSSNVQIPVEIVSEEEMAFLEAALASTRPLLSSSSYSSAASSSPTRFAALTVLPSLLSRSSSTQSVLRPHSLSTTLEIEDLVPSRSSLLHRFRPSRGLSVTDITSTEWCEKQMEFTLLHGKPKRTKAMEAGSDRHSQLENEVVEKVEIHVKSVEESWALKLMNFIVGAHQLLFEGLTREIPVIGVIERTWMVGIIDEIRMHEDGDTISPSLLDTKTRYTARLPSDAQKRNARFQLMCYKYLWDNLVKNNFSFDQFFHHFNLNRWYLLSGDVKKHIFSLGFDVKTLQDVCTCFQDTCRLLSPSHEQLLLRYELQSDHSLLEEYYFSYDSSWFHKQVHRSLEFWLGERVATFVSEGEKWKCSFCSFASMCSSSAATSCEKASMLLNIISSSRNKIIL